MGEINSSVGELMSRRIGRLVTIGSFDGVHLGHMALLDRTVAEAKKRRLTSLALTFNIPPRMILDRNKKISVLSNPIEKEKLIKSRGIDEIVQLDFDRGFSKIKPYAFFRGVLLERFKAKGIVVGLDFRFGVNRSAGAVELVRWGEEMRIPVWVIPPVKLRREVVSSTTIRELLLKDNLNHANQLLGHPYLIHGSVVKGHGKGKKLGYPTTNLKTSRGKVLPQGVFVVRGTAVGGSERPLLGVCNIGRRPTFYRRSSIVVEPHWLGSSFKKTPKAMFIELLTRLRGEKKFKSPSELVRAIQADR